MEDIVFSNGVKATKFEPKKKKRKLHILKAFILSFVSSILALILLVIFLAYGPIGYFRDTWVTTAMTTFNHQWLATMLYDQNTINTILYNNRTVEPNFNTDPTKIVINSESNGNTPKDNGTTLPSSPQDGERIIDGIGFTRLHTSSYYGWLIKIYDPSRLYMSVSNNIGKTGEKITDMAKSHNAFIGINAAAFVDIGGHGNGGTADGLLIANGQRYKEGTDKPDPRKIIGLDFSDRLQLLSTTTSALTTIKLKDAIEFKPFLIVNGSPAKFYGNGGYGTQPRTAIGQTDKGAILFAVIDGRSLISEGATVVDLQNIMLQYGAVNAANLDGGSSSVLVVDGSLISIPASQYGERRVPAAFLINHTSGWNSSVKVTTSK